MVLGALLGGMAPAAVAASSVSPVTSNPGATAEATWSPGYALIELEQGADLQEARRAVQARGGTVALLLPPRYLTGWIPSQLDAALVGRAGIRAVYRAGDTDRLPGGGWADQAVTRFFARAARGELDGVEAANGPPFDADEPRRPDGWDHGVISEEEIAANLRQLGIPLPDRGGAPWLDKSGTTSLATNSDYMTGTVSVSLFFVESDGTGTDPDEFDWTPTAEQAAFADAAAALSWWASEAEKRSGCWVVFRLEAHFATEDARCSQWREPTLHPSSDYAYVVQQVLANFGYTSGNHLSRASAFNAAMRIQNQTDWAYSVFAAANPSGPSQFTDGYAAWSYIGGPYASMLQRSFSWQFKQVFAHETAHMFRACDEYYTPGYGGCTGCGGCADTGVENGNCEECNPNPVSCMMRSNAWALCDWTAGQVGWWQTPCTAHEYPAPRIDTSEPSTTVQGIDVDIDVRGDFFVDGTTVGFGPDITVLTQDVLSDSLIRARIHVPLEISPGMRDVEVRGPDAQSDRLVDGLEIRATPRHYVSTSGSSTYPYDTPARAAADPTTVIAACSAGDTICIAGGTYEPFAVHRNLVVLGGWTAGFAVRAPQTSPSIIDAAGAGPALLIDGSGKAPVLDGLVLRGGRATQLATEDLGPMPMGGALQVIDAAPILRNCTLEASTAGDGSTPGAGGGGFFWHASPTLLQCTVRDNHATRGAGLFFLHSTATLRDVAVETNDGGGSGLGSGIGVLGGSLEYTDGSLLANGGAFDGGGLYLEGVSFAHLEHLTIDGNTAARAGGGIASRSSRVELDGSRLTRNHAGERGGGYDAADDSLVVDGCVVADNVALSLGGGLSFNSCDATLRNLTIAGNDGGPASGVLWSYGTSNSSMRDGIVAGNTLGGFVVTGGAPPVLDWNLFAMNGGLDRVGVLAGKKEQDADPLFVSPGTLDFRLGLGSPAIDGGDPYSERPDLDGSRNDCGAHGGPHAWPAAPARITDLRALRNDSTADLHWSPSPETGASYLIYRDSIPDFPTSEANHVGTVAAPNTSWSDSAPLQWGRYKVVVVDAEGHASAASIDVAAALPSDTAGGPASFALHRIAPNPANPGAWIDYELPSATDARLVVFSARGARVRLLATGPASRGRRRIYWDGNDDQGRPVASGVYWVRLLAGGDHRTRKLVVVR